MLPRWGAVICATTAHVHTDEGGAPEKSGGIKLLPITTPDGKLTPDLIAKEAWGLDDEHRAQPLVVHITQSSELGTVYTAYEVRAITDYAHGRGMRVCMDGAHLSKCRCSA
jgi:threonine aldolase